MDMEVGDIHGERPEDLLAEEVVERLAGYHFDQTPENVGGIAVAPAGTRVVEEGQRSQVVYKLFQGQLFTISEGLAIEVFDGGVLVPSVA